MGKHWGGVHWPKLIQRYVFPAILTAVTLVIRLAIDGQLKDRPTLIVFAVPIMLSAYVGGLQAGLLATALSYVCATYYLLPPFHSFRIASVPDRWDLLLVILAGVIISILNEALHLARRQAAIANHKLQVQLALVKAEALESAIYRSANFSSIATDTNGVIQTFNVGAERMLGYTADEVVNKLTLTNISNQEELISRAADLTREFATPIAPDCEALMFKASRGIEDISELREI